MTMSKLIVFARERQCCELSPYSFNVRVTNCCGKEVATGMLPAGRQLDLEVPPGCYIVESRWSPDICCGKLRPTMVIVPCGEAVCVNLIREWGEEILLNIIPMAKHLREAKIPDPEIDKVVGYMRKVAGTIPKEKLLYMTEKEVKLLEENTSREYKDLVRKYANVITGKEAIPKGE